MKPFPEMIGLLAVPDNARVSQQERNGEPGSCHIC